MTKQIDTHNGWTNYATWRVALSIMNNRPRDPSGWLVAMQDKVSADDCRTYVSEHPDIDSTLAVFLQAVNWGDIDSTLSAFLQAVNWGEIADHINKVIVQEQEQ